MPIATLTAIRHSYGTHTVLDGATLSLDPGERVGLVGRNGQGKSTLLRMLAGLLEPDEGTVQVERGRRAGYLHQHPDLDPTDTVRSSVERAFGRLFELHQRQHALFEEMAAASAEAPEVMQRLLRRQADVEHELEAAGGYVVEHRIEQALHGVGFVDSQFEQRVATLSGGQQGRLALARLLLESPDLLLLDEPTNHLDIEGRRWLEEFLAEEFAGTVVLVSHDRWLLDRVVTRIVEVEEGVLREYPGNYGQYRTLRVERQMAQDRVHQKQLDRIRQEEAFIRRYKAGQRAKQARGRQTRLDRYKRDELVERPVELDTFDFRLPPAPRVGDHVLVAQDLSKSYGPLTLFRGLSLSVAPGERIGIVGPNGAGKTTLVKCLLGEEEPDSGSVRRSPQLRSAWFRQTQDHLDLRLSVWEYLQSVIVGEDGSARASEQHARDLAGAFLFSGADQEKALAVLSGGERSRAVIAGLVASARNLLVLDEPTNHLDIPSAERLEAALGADPDDGGFSGAILLVSHDRALLDHVCDRLVILDGKGNAEVFAGGLREWLDREESKRSGSAAASARSKPPAKAALERTRGAAAPARARGAAAPPNPEDAATKRRARELARLSQEELDRRIEKLESELARIDARLADPSTWSDATKARSLPMERDRISGELAPLEEEWLRRAEEEAE